MPSETPGSTAATKLAPVLTVDPHVVPPNFHVKDIEEKFHNGIQEDDEDEERAPRHQLTVAGAP